MTREEAIYKWVLPALENTWNKKKCMEIIEALGQQPCEDCINRQAVLDGLASIAKAKAKSDAQKSLMGRIMFFVEKLPPVTPQLKMGHWIYIGNSEVNGLKICKCSNCEKKTYGSHKFCPNCGQPKIQEVMNDVD